MHATFLIFLEWSYIAWSYTAAYNGETETSLNDFWPHL